MVLFTFQTGFTFAPNLYNKKVSRQPLCNLESGTLSNSKSIKIMTNVIILFETFKKFVCIFVLFVATGSASLLAQTVKGTVVDNRTNEPIVGATIRIGADVESNGVVTDLNGQFSLKAPSLPVVIRVSYIGYHPQEIDIYELSDAITIHLSEDLNLLNEVVVIGYKQTRQKDVTGAISTVKSADLENINSVSLVNKLQGAVPGLLVSSNSGVPGSSSLIRLRGASSITAGNSPIYIIDGTFVSTASLQQQDLGGQRIDPLSDINPDDIESISVLKDASATAAYGARGANGVILITTRRGKRNTKTSVNFNAEFSAARAENLWKLTTGPQHAEIVNEAYRNDSRWASRPFRPIGESPNLGTAYGNPEDQPTYSRIPDIFRTAYGQKYNLSVTGGTETTSFYLSGEINRQESTLKMQDFNRNSFRLNLDHAINSRLKIGTSNTLSFTDRELVRVGDGPAGLFQAALHTPTFYPIYKEDGTYNKPVAFDNHQAIIDHSDGHSRGLRIINNVYATWEIIKGLSFKTSWNNDRNIYHENFYYNTYLKDGSTNDGLAYDRISWLNVFGAEQLLNYLRTFNGQHTVSAFLGNSYQKTAVESESLTGTNFPSNEFKRISSASSQTATSTGTSSALLSYFGGVNYSYKDRYNLDLTLRADGSSRVSADNRWGYFPAVGVIWNVSNEPFFSKNERLTNLLLKGSWGVTGNEAIDDFAALGLWRGGGDYDGKAGLAPYQLSNSELKWETTRQWNVGLSFGLLKNRINIEIDYYNKYTYDLLLNEPLAGKTGLNSITKNSGEVSNKGFELAINTVNIENRTFSWKTNLTLSHNKNKIEKLPVEDQGGYTMFKLIEGHPLYSFWVWEYLGVNPETGDAIYDDRTGDGKITIDDKKIIEDAWPDVEGILKNTLTYKNWSLDFSFYFKYGNSLFNYTRMFLESGGINGVGRSIQASQLNYWKEANKGAYAVNAGGLVTGVLPRPKSTANADGLTNYERQSSRFVEDGSFVRLRNVTLSYLIPKTLTSKIGIQRAALYVTGSNLLLISDYSGPDPEVNLDRDNRSLVQGLDFGTPPQPRSIIAGVNITF
jgi:TonB-linked SusC/RagA family outer membrane protein